MKKMRLSTVSSNVCAYGLPWGAWAPNPMASKSPDRVMPTRSESSCFDLQGGAERFEVFWLFPGRRGAPGLPLRARGRSTERPARTTR
jgi:hypothetical protein